MSKQSEFRKMVTFLFDGYPGKKIKKSELKEIFSDEKEINSLVLNGFLFEEQTSGSNENNYSLGPHTIEIVLAWKTEELTSKIQRLTIIVLFIGILLILTLGASFVMQLVQFFLK